MSRLLSHITLFMVCWPWLRHIPAQNHPKSVQTHISSTPLRRIKSLCGADVGYRWGSEERQHFACWPAVPRCGGWSSIPPLHSGSSIRPTPTNFSEWGFVGMF